MTGAPYNSVTTPAVNAATTTNSGMPRAKDPPRLPRSWYGSFCGKNEKRMRSVFRHHSKSITSRSNSPRPSPSTRKYQNAKDTRRARERTSLRFPSCRPKAQPAPKSFAEVLQRVELPQLKRIFPGHPAHRGYYRCYQTPKTIYKRRRFYGHRRTPYPKPGAARQKK